MSGLLARRKAVRLELDGHLSEKGTRHVRPRSLLICMVLIDFNGHSPRWEYHRVFQKINDPLREPGSRTRTRAPAAQ